MPTTSALPEGWESCAIGDLCELINGRGFKKTERSSSGLPIIRIQNLNNYKAKFNYYNGEYKEQIFVNKGDLLFAWSGTPGTSFGAHIWNGPEGVLNQHIFRVLNNDNLIRKEYFARAFNHKLIELIAGAHGGVGLRHITKNKLEATQIPLPPLNEQRRIADKINELQARSRRAREALETVKPLLDKLRQSVLAAAFRGDLTAEWRKQSPEVEPASKLLERIRAERRARWEEAELLKMRAKGQEPKNNKWKAKYKEPEPVDTKELSKLPKGWSWIRLEQCVYDGPTNGYSPKSSDDAKGSLSLKLSATTTGNFLANENTTKRLYETISPDSNYWLQNGDVLIQRANSLDYLGTTAVYGGENNTFIYPDLMMRVRTCLPELSHWIRHWFHSPMGKCYVRDNANGIAGNMPKINGKTVRNALIPVPSIEELQVAVTMVNGLEKQSQNLSSLINAQLSRVTDLDRSILAKAFRGKLVPQDPNDEPASVLLERIKTERETPKGKRKGRKKHG
ncbi:MAG: restriction endonuclease subunit S [Proteobacteria bacterium]|nr:restriction endonuclease subunit S [Pseudomonadota bacterium]